MRVIAIESSHEGVVRSYGEGEFIGNLIPNTEPFNTVDLINPCIKLDTGKYVWGFQCWWGPLEEVKEKMYKNAKEVVIVDVEEQVLPKEDKVKLEWWGYKHTSGTLQVKRYFSKLDIDEANESPFCEQVHGPFLATDREDALQQLEKLVN